MTVRSIQYTESQGAIADYGAVLANVMKAENAIVEMHRAHPDLASPAHVARVVAPFGRQYVDLVDRVLAAITRKQALLEVFGRTEAVLSADVSKIMEFFHKHMVDKIESIGGTYVTEADVAELHDLAVAKELSAKLMENVMSARREIWQAIAVVQAGGGVEGMQRITDKVEGIRKQAESLTPEKPERFPCYCKSGKPQELPSC